MAIDFKGAVCCPCLLENYEDLCGADFGIFLFVASSFPFSEWGKSLKKTLFAWPSWKLESNTYSWMAQGLMCIVYRLIYWISLIRPSANIEKLYFILMKENYWFGESIWIIRILDNDFIAFVERTIFVYIILLLFLNIHYIFLHWEK